MLADPGSTNPLIGASGAIAGVMGAYLVMWPRARVLTWIPLLLIVVVFLPAWLVLAVWFGLQFFTSPNESVAWLAHVGGFVFGVAVASAVRQLRGPPAPAARAGRRTSARSRVGRPRRPVRRVPRRLPRARLSAGEELGDERGEVVGDERRGRGRDGLARRRSTAP